MSYAQLVVIAIGGYVMLAIALYCAHFNARLAMKLKSLYVGADKRCEDALAIAREAIDAAERIGGVRR